MRHPFKVASIVLLVLVLGGASFVYFAGGELLQGSVRPTDRDRDGMPDTWERLFGLDTTVNDAANDLDSDDLTNVDEFYNFTEPSKSDSDGDVMTDGWEVYYGLDPLLDDGNSNADGDTLVNGQEFLCDLDPTNDDSDGDGTYDQDEKVTCASYASPSSVTTEGGE